jgi:hypothetical protein
MKIKLIVLALFLALFVFGINSSSYAHNKNSKKSNKTMVVDSAKTKSHHTWKSTKHHMTHKTTKTHTALMKSKTTKSKKDTSKAK